MASSKKLVIEFNPEKPDKPSCEFLIPFISDNGELAFLGTKSGTIRHYGLVILTNRAGHGNRPFCEAHRYRSYRYSRGYILAVVFRFFRCDAKSENRKHCRDKGHG